MNRQMVAQAEKKSFMPYASGLLQRKCDRCHEKILQRSAVGSAPETVPPIVHEVLRSPGQPLDRETRAFFEPRFGHDFSNVRVHTAKRYMAQAGLTMGPVDDRFEQEANRISEAMTRTSEPQASGSLSSPCYSFDQVRTYTDANAAESAREVNAKAYTVGQNIVFGTGQYQPGTKQGNKLLAHELAHVIQQHRGTSGYVQRMPKRPGRRIEEINKPKLSLYQDQIKSGEFLRGLANKKARDIKSITFNLNLDECPTSASYGSIPYKTGSDIIEAITTAYVCTGYHQVKEIHIFSHAGGLSYSPTSGMLTGLHGADDMAHGLYQESVLSHEDRAQGARTVNDIPDGVLASDAIFVLHGCNTAIRSISGDSFAEVLLKAILGGSPKAKVYGHFTSVTCGTYTHWTEFSKKHPKGIKVRENPYHKSPEE